MTLVILKRRLAYKGAFDIRACRDVLHAGVAAHVDSFFPTLTPPPQTQNPNFGVISGVPLELAELDPEQNRLGLL